jgi:hypothetical protein
MDPLGDNGDHNRQLFLFTCGAATPAFTDAGGFPNGTFKPGAPVQRRQMANFLHNLAGRPALDPPIEPTFSDVAPTHPFFLPIEWMADTGIAGGFADGTFRPRNPVRRAQMANFLHHLAGRPAFTPPATPSFSDVPAGHPFLLQVEWMAANDIASGFADGSYRPNRPVTRAQMANFLLNLVNGPGIDLVN